MVGLTASTGAEESGFIHDHRTTLHAFDQAHGLHDDPRIAPDRPVWVVVRTLADAGPGGDGGVGLPDAPARTASTAGTGRFITTYVIDAPTGLVILATNSDAGSG